MALVSKHHPLAHLGCPVAQIKPANKHLHKQHLPNHFASCKITVIIIMVAYLLENYLM
jgi:hypothetical protein